MLGIKLYVTLCARARCCCTFTCLSLVATESLGEPSKGLWRTFPKSVGNEWIGGEVPLGTKAMEMGRINDSASATTVQYATTEVHSHFACCSRPSFKADL